jgi:hypothetical protein
VLSGITGLQVLGHIDCGDSGTWRNLVDFDPLAKYGGFTYEVRGRGDAEALCRRPDEELLASAPSG